MKKTIFLIGSFVLLFILNSAFGQVTVWSEDFEAAIGNGGYTGVNGVWTVTSTGTNAGDAGKWRVNDTECGAAAGACGSAGCGDQSLFMGTSDFLYGFGFTGAAMFADATAETNKRIESPTIDCSAHTSITIKFDYIEGRAGDPGIDLGEDATLWYFDGTTWAQIDPLVLTPNTCNPQGAWTEFATFALPASADNNANVKIGFHWTSDADADGIDPSFAVDDILIEGIAGVATPSVTADFTQNTPSPICEGTSITFTDASTESNTTITSWDWSFEGGDVTTANTVGPHTITFNTAGTFDIELTVSDGTISNTSTVSLVVNAASDAGTDGSANLCNDATLDLSTLLSGADAGGIWSETSGTASGQFTGSTLDGNGLTVGNIYTFDYTVTGTAPCSDAISTFTITIIDCSAGTPPTASFTPSQTEFCVGECITFADNSTPGDITDWAWDFDGGATNSAIQNPGSVCFNTPGVYNVTLTVTNPFGNNTSAATVITVNGNPIVTANASPSTSICTGDQVTLSGGGAVNYSWTNGATDGVAFTPTVGINNYTVTGTDANMCTNTADIQINVADCVPMVAGFSFDDNICVGSCINFTDTTSGSPVSWSWDFGTDASPVSSTNQNPESICFNTIGVFSIQLTATDSGGTSVSTTNSITVHPSPSITATLDTLIDLGGEAELIATSPDIGTYLWTPGTYYIECDTCASTIAQPQLSVDYFVTITSPNGCTAEDTVSVEVNFIEGIGVPQAFSPNGDGQNDQLVVKGFGIDQMDFKIYNRYGQLVFESTIQEHGWDGTFKGKDENPGVFVWVLEYHLINGSVGNLQGNTTLIR